MIERLKSKFGVNEPIFTSEVLEEMRDYSRPRVFQLLKQAEERGEILKFDTGVYYIPTETRYGKSILPVEQVVKKKYIASKQEVYGIYSGLQLQQNFRLTYQVPTAIEVVTNKETMWVREIKLKNRSIILRKSRTPITKKNADAYTILELFSKIDMKKYREDELVLREIENFINERVINVKEIYELSRVFPAKATKNLMESGLLSEFA